MQLELELDVRVGVGVTRVGVSYSWSRSEFYFLRWFVPQCGTISSSSQVSVDSSKAFPCPQAIRRGNPLTQVMSLLQSPGTGNLG